MITFDNEYDLKTEAGSIISFRASVELCDVRDVEPLDKLVPNLRPESVAEHEPNLVLAFFRTFRSVQQIAADFSDVLSGLIVRKG